jgi:GNAT superfamily N-acetyltransferase
MSDFRNLIIHGGAVSIREVGPGDIPAIDAMHDRLSRQTLYLRYFASRKPSLEALQGQMHSSKGGGSAFVAVAEGTPAEVVGLAYYLPVPGGAEAAEPAVLVEDRFQGNGLGQALLEALVRQARYQAIRYFKAYVLPENQRVLHMFSKQGLPFKRHYRDGLYELEMGLQPPAREVENSQAVSAVGQPGQGSLYPETVQLKGA